MNSLSQLSPRVLRSSLSHRIAFYIPSRTRKGNRAFNGVTHGDLLRVVINFFTKEFHSATQIAGEGFFQSPKMKALQKESIKIVYCYARRKKLIKLAPVIEELANDLAVCLDQVSLAFEIDDRIYFAQPNEAYRKDISWRRKPVKTNRAWLKRSWSKYWNFQT